MKSFLLIAILALMGLAQAADSAKSLRGSRPNIIVVMTDDQGKGDLPCLGNKYIRSPHLDNFYRQATRFTAFQVSPTCAPTRSALLTGRHEFMNGITHTLLERERMTLQATTLAQSLSAAGYATGIFGKWHLGDEEPYQPQNRGFQEVFIHGAGGIGQVYDSSCADAPPNAQMPGRYFDPVIRHNGQFVKTTGFCTDVFTRAALGWIKKNKDAGTPFFAYVTPNAPHDPLIAPEAYKKRFLEMGFDDSSAARMGMLENIDDNIGLMMNKLAEWGMEENTLFIFMTDNGQAIRSGKLHDKNVSIDFSGYKTGKGSPGEGGTCVPAFWRWKGILGAGVDIPALTAHIDLFPTLAELTNAAIPADQVMGRSLVPLLASPSAPWDDRFLFTHVGRWEKGVDPESAKYKKCAVRTQRFRLVDNKALYDLIADPFESKNVIADHPEQVAAMRAAYEAWWTKAVPLMVNENVPNSPSRPYFEWYEAQNSSAGIPTWISPTF